MNEKWNGLGELIDATLTEKGVRLRPAQRQELEYLARGECCKDSANAQGLSCETVRARRKQIYAAVGTGTADETISMLLASALCRLAPAQPQVAS